jgi:hypothetical protein
MATKKVEHYTGTRITFHSTQPFDSIMAKLYASIGGPESIPAWLEVAKGITSYSAESRDKFISTTEKHVGPHGFMIFQVRLTASSLPFNPSHPLFPSPSPSHLITSLSPTHERN